MSVSTFYLMTANLVQPEFTCSESLQEAAVGEPPFFTGPPAGKGVLSPSFNAEDYPGKLDVQLHNTSHFA